ncbi:hypothetical protein ACWDR1_34315 [Streptosporangium sandarakinum]
MHVHIASSDGFGPVGVIAPFTRVLHVTGDDGTPAGVSEAGPLSSPELADPPQLTGRRRSADADEGVR